MVVEFSLTLYYIAAILYLSVFLILLMQVADSLLHDESSNLETLIFCSQTLRSKVNGKGRSHTLHELFRNVILPPVPFIRCCCSLRNVPLIRRLLETKAGI